MKEYTIKSFEMQWTGKPETEYKPAVKPKLNKSQRQELVKLKKQLNQA